MRNFETCNVGDEQRKAKMAAREEKNEEIGSQKRRAVMEN
jgi:hypothetical protein